MIKTLKLFVAIFAIAGLLTAPAFADSNATGGGVANSETVFLGSGAFSHGGAIGSLDNTIISGISFTGGFNATHINFSGTATSVLGATWGSEADIQLRQGLSSYDWQNPGPFSTYTTFDYDSSDELTGGFAGGIDPGAGFWEVEFFDTFDDGSGADSESSNVSMTFEEQVAISDPNGVFSLGTVSGGASSVGEFALSNLYDIYSITLATDGVLNFFTDEDPTGFVGSNADTEIAIFDSAGILLAENDDIDFPSNTYSEIIDLLLTAGDYTLVVASYDTTFADGFVVNAGDGTGDYSLSVNFAPVPVPAAVWFLGSALLGLFGMRRRA